MVIRGSRRDLLHLYLNVWIGVPKQVYKRLQLIRFGVSEIGIQILNHFQTTTEAYSFYSSDYYVTYMHISKEWIFIINLNMAKS